MKQKILEYLNSAFGLDGSDAEELFVSYVQSINENVEKLGREAAAKDFAAVAKTAHSIKGCALNCGHTEMAEAAKAAEFAAKAQESGPLDENAAKISAIGKSLVEELK